MVNGTGLGGGWSTTQSALIVMLPGSSALYYVFTIQDQSMAGNFSYSIVDMSLQSGAGQVTVKNVLLTTNVTEKLTAVKNISGSNAWVLTHERGSNNLQSWLLTSSGIAASPVVSACGDSVILNDDYIGQMKFSPDGTKIGATFFTGNFVNLFDFDAASGIVSNARHLSIPNAFYGAYGLEFSPSSQFLYATPLTASGIYQWDVTLSSQAAINSSMQQIGSAPGGFSGAMQLGPDNKIYIAEYNVSSLGRINQPDNPGTTCNYIAGNVSTGSATVTLGLPGYILAASSTPLPVTLLSFSGKVNGATNILSWITASEKNNRLFSIQCSHGEKGFKTIGVIDGAGNSSQLIHYSFVDNHPETGVNYYRLEQMDYNGQTSFSNTISLVNLDEPVTDLMVFPNPAKDFITVRSRTDYHQTEISDAKGNILYLASFSNEIDISDWCKGVYFLRVNSLTGYSCLKFSIDR